MSGAMVVDMQNVHVHCWDVDAFNSCNYGAFNIDGPGSGCFALRVGSSGEVVEDSLSPLLQPPERPCHCSDSGRFVVAGGEDDDND